MKDYQIDLLEEGKRVLRVEADALMHAMNTLDQSFAKAVALIDEALQSGGKIVVTAVGKSGNIAQKVAATLTSTGSMAIFLHPTEALHGDLGLLREKDILLVFSHSGSTEEIISLLPAARSLCKSIVAVLGNPNGSIAGQVDLTISAAVSAEACPNNLAPTASSTLALAIGDALAMVLQKLSGFSPDHFARIHPAGKLGKRLLIRVSDLMHKEGNIALLSPKASMEEVLMALTQYRHSGVCIVDGKTKSGKAKLAGIITEGDIRRALKHQENFFKLAAKEIMTVKPATVTPDTKAMDALEIMEQRERQLSFLPVVDNEGGCLGVLRVHDLVLAGLN